MKKSSILGIACAMLLGQSAFAQSTTTAVTFVEDPAQGTLLNQFKDNWFITAEGGANMLFHHRSTERKFFDRFGPAASVWVGKWFSPVFGARLGVNWMGVKGMADGPEYPGVLINDYRPNGYYKTKFNIVGPQFNTMVNLTNWVCGYHPNRVYNLIAYVGGGVYFGFDRQVENGEQTGYKYDHNKQISLNAGVINQFTLANRWKLQLDVRYNLNEGNDNGLSDSRCQNIVSAYLGVTYELGKNYWGAPVVPVIDTEVLNNCDALEARLQAANARINDLERELKDCLSRPQTETVVNDAPLATIYYPINVSRLTNVDRKVLEAVSEVMKSNPDQKYVVTGWADNYTGTDAINTRLRHARANGVQKCLLNNGVDAGQLDVTINNGNLYNGGEKYVSLDRAVTIEEAK